jgi:histidyl-tRNA synthetase
MYDEAFRNLGITHYELRINNRKILAGIAEVVKSIDVMSTIAVAIDKLDKIGEEGVRKELTEQGFSEDELTRLFDIILIKGENSTILNQLKSKLQTSTEGLKGIEELEFMFNSLNHINQSTVTLSGAEMRPINLKTDFSLARGLSYYTGAIFEVVSTEGSLKSSIGGGGRYDNLTGIFGLPNVSGVGISFGLDRIYDVMEELNLFPQGLNITSTQVLICAFDEPTQTSALAILKKLRDTQIASELYPELPQSKKDKENPLQKPMNYADALHIPFRLIIKQDSMLLKDIKGAVIPVSTVEDIINQIK